MDYANLTLYTLTYTTIWFCIYAWGIAIMEHKTIPTKNKLIKIMTILSLPFFAIIHYYKKITTPPPEEEQA